MVFSGKIYDQVKEKLDKYLFGFDKNQLDVSLLKGKPKRPLTINPINLARKLRLPYLSLKTSASISSTLNCY